MWLLLSFVVEVRENIDILAMQVYPYRDRFGNRNFPFLLHHNVFSSSISVA